MRPTPVRCGIAGALAILYFYSAFKSLVNQLGVFSFIRWFASSPPCVSCFSRSVLGTLDLGLLSSWLVMLHCYPSWHYRLSLIWFIWSLLRTQSYIWLLANSFFNTHCINPNPLVYSYSESTYKDYKVIILKRHCKSMTILCLLFVT